VELHSIKIARGIGRDGERRIGGGAKDLKPRRNRADVIPVGHPDLLRTVIEPTVQHRQGGFWRHIGATELSGAMAPLNGAPQHVHHDLLAVADAQDWHTQIKHRLRRAGRSGVDHTGRSTGQNHRLGRKGFQKLGCHVLERMNLAINAQFPQATRNKLGHLAAEVDDQKALVGACIRQGICHGAGLRLQ